MNRNMLWGSLVGASVMAVLAYKGMHMRRHRHENGATTADDLVNQSVDDSFPASDPPSYTPTGGSTVSARDTY